MLKRLLENLLKLIAMKTIYKLTKLTWACILMLFPILILAQTATTTINGSINDRETKQAISGATITLVGTNISTISNTEGDFALKIMEATTSPSLLIEALGYKNSIQDIANVDDDINIRLSPKSVDLSEVQVVGYKSAKELVKKVFNKKRENYIGKPLKMTAFYRETIKKRKKNASLAEAVVSIQKEGYISNKEDQIRLLKSRKSTDYAKLDTIALKLQGGPFSTLYVDVMKYPEYIFTPETMDAYHFSFATPTELNGKDVLVVGFEPKPNIVGPLYAGQLYVSATSLALQKATFTLDLTNEIEVNKMFVRSKPNGVRVKARDISYEVDYREKNGKWYYGYGKANLSFEVKKRRRLFKSIYTLSCEMAVTDWKVTTADAFSKDGEISPSIIMADENLGFGDPEFWGEYNVIEPERSIEAAIKKIKRNLEKEDNYRASLGGK